MRQFLFLKMNESGTKIYKIDDDGRNEYFLYIYHDGHIAFEVIDYVTNISEHFIELSVTTSKGLKEYL